MKENRIVAYLKKFKNDPVGVAFDTLVYTRQGYLYPQFLLSIISTAILINIKVLPSWPLWAVMVATGVIAAPAIILAGKLDFKKGSFPRQSIISVKNSVPTRDLYITLLAMSKKALDEEEYEEIKAKLYRWLEEDEKQMLEEMGKKYESKY